MRRTLWPLSRLRPWLLAAALMSIQAGVGIAHAETGSPPDDFIESRELQDAIKTRDIDLIREALNTVKAMRYQGEILPFARDLWDGAEAKYPDLPWDVVRWKIIRVEIADVLLQAVRNHRIEMDTEGIHDYLKKLVTDSDSQVASNAMMTLSIVDDESDVDQILKVARQQNPQTFRPAVIALTRMCNSKATQALQQLEREMKASELRSYLVDTMAQSWAFEERSGFCHRPT